MYTEVFTDMTLQAATQNMFVIAQACGLSNRPAISHCQYAWHPLNRMIDRPVSMNCTVLRAGLKCAEELMSARGARDVPSGRMGCGKTLCAE